MYHLSHGPRPGQKCEWFPLSPVMSAEGSSPSTSLLTHLGSHFLSIFLVLANTFDTSSRWDYGLYCSKDATKVPKERIKHHVKMQVYTKASIFRDLVGNLGAGQPRKAVQSMQSPSPMRRVGAETQPCLAQWIPWGRVLPLGRIEACSFAWGTSVAQPFPGRHRPRREGYFF